LVEQIKKYRYGIKTVTIATPGHIEIMVHSATKKPHPLAQDPYPTYLSDLPDVLDKLANDTLLDDDDEDDDEEAFGTTECHLHAPEPVKPVSTEWIEISDSGDKTPPDDDDDWELP
tara:strand:+ start:384 stop:731 length:348 start_codon:yes stop_codon:yes gene_type:complete